MRTRLPRRSFLQKVGSGLISFVPALRALVVVPATPLPSDIRECEECYLVIIHIEREPCYQIVCGIRVSAICDFIFFGCYDVYTDELCFTFWDVIVYN